MRNGIRTLSNSCFSPAALLVFVSAAGCSTFSPKGETEAVTPPQAVTPGFVKERQKNEEAGKPILVNFMKPGCPACAKLATGLAELKKEYLKKVRFIDIDTSVAKRLVFDCMITLTPTVIIYVDNKEVKRLLNPKPEEIRKVLDEILHAES